MSGFVIAPATCPKCGEEKEGVYVRDFELDDLICQACRDGGGREPSESVTSSVVPSIPAFLRREDMGRIMPSNTPPTRRVPSCGWFSRRNGETGRTARAQASSKDASQADRSVSAGRIL